MTKLNFYTYPVIGQNMLIKKKVVEYKIYSYSIEWGRACVSLDFYGSIISYLDLILPIIRNAYCYTLVIILIFLLDFITHIPNQPDHIHRDIAREIIRNL